MKTGFTELDELMTLDEEKLIILAGSSEMGKSTLGLNIASCIAFRENLPILYFNLEKSKEEILKMIISAESMVKKNKLEHGKADDEEWQKLKEGIKELRESEIIINDTPEISVEEICSRSRKLVKEKGVKFILIDYIQLITCNTDETLSKEAILSVAKNRNGKTGVVELLALFDYCKFANIYREEKENGKK